MLSFLVDKLWHAACSLQGGVHERLQRGLSMRGKKGVTSRAAGVVKGSVVWGPAGRGRNFFLVITLEMATILGWKNECPGRAF